jgi:hypothetical protein
MVHRTRSLRSRPVARRPVTTPAMTFRHPWPRTLKTPLLAEPQRNRSILKDRPMIVMSTTSGPLLAHACPDACPGHSYRACAKLRRPCDFAYSLVQRGHHQVLSRADGRKYPLAPGCPQNRPHAPALAFWHVVRNDRHCRRRRRMTAVDLAPHADPERAHRPTVSRSRTRANHHSPAHPRRRSPRTRATSR